MGRIIKKTTSGETTVNGHEVSRGLGDTIAKITKAVGIKPCGGCKKRQERLNKAVPYKQPPG